MLTFVIPMIPMFPLYDVVAWPAPVRPDMMLAKPSMKMPLLIAWGGGTGASEKREAAKLLPTVSNMDERVVASIPI